MSNLQLKTPLRLDHLAVWVSDMDQTLAFLTDVVGFKQHPMVIEVEESDPTCGGMKAIFADGNGLWLELILPTAPGPGMDILEQVGNGAIVEVNFEAVDEDYRNLIDDMSARGIQMLGMDGSDLKDYGRIDEGVAGHEESKASGQYIAYWPTELTGGTTIEVYEKVSDDESNLLNIRDREWQHNVPNPNSPCIDYISVIVSDLEHAASFYTDIMGLTRCEGTDNSEGAKTVWIDANGVRIQLCQPTKPGPMMDLMAEKGSGYTAKVVATVDDYDGYCAALENKGIRMRVTGADSICFPEDINCGMTIEITRAEPAKRQSR
jgi:catechol 2,3-dioxygenase-like lactoylglutathione lyase family enzyme